MSARDSTAPTTMPLPVGTAASRLPSEIDPWITGAAVVLLSIGTVMVYSASAVRAGDDASYFLSRHLGSIGLGLLALMAALRIPIDRWSRAAYPLLAVSVALLIAVYVPGLGRRVNGSLRWLALGPISFQPAELAKLAVVVYLAHSLAKKRERVSSFSVGFLPHVLTTGGIVALIIAQPDIGTSAVVFACLGVMLFVAGTRIGYLVLAVLAALPVAYHYVATRPHAWARMLVFLNPEAYKQDIGYQIWESLVAFGSGGLSGLGLGDGRQKLFFLPEAHTDFIFAIVGQELGFVGVIAVIGSFAVLVGRSLWIATRLPCRFPMFLCFGFGSWIGIQALVNMAVVLAVLPTKGLTLPLVSYGRSSIVVTLLVIGILLRVSAEHRASLAAGTSRDSRRTRPRREVTA